jgi:hypothetical protein
MEKQNITLALPKDILRKVKIIAIHEGTSVSGLLTRILKELVSREEGYKTALRNHLTTLEGGINLGTEGAAQWTREELHER